jgi:protein TonB
MANDLLNPPEAETATTSGSQRDGRTGSLPQPGTETGHELDAFLGKAFEEKSVWAGLFDNVHELFFPTKLPPLELTSTPIPVPDRMAVKRSPLSVAISAGINIGVLALALFAFRHQIEKVMPLNLTNIDANISPWKPTTPKTGKMGGGGGGGAHDITPPNKGHLPKIDPKPLLQPTPVQVEKPKIPMESAIDIQKNIKLPDNPTLPLVGMTQSPNVTLASQGQGSNGGMGTGSHGGLGSGNGDGYGPGTGGNLGGGLRRVGDGVSPPKAIFQPEAEFSDEARRAKYEGTVVVTLIVDANGNPQNVHVTRTLGMGLDEKAVEAVQKYKFKPAMDQKSGKPVPVMVSVEVRFRLY